MRTCVVVAEINCIIEDPTRLASKMNVEQGSVTLR